MAIGLCHKRGGAENSADPEKMTFTTASGLLPAGIAVYVRGGRTEFVRKHDIRLGCKALGLKAKDADQIDYCQLGKMYVVKASTKNKALRDFRSEPQWPVRTPTL